MTTARRQSWSRSAASTRTSRRCETAGGCRYRSGPPVSADTRVPLGHRRPVLYFLVGFLPPLVLLAVMGMAWVEDHLLPAAETPRQAPTLPVREPGQPAV